MELQALLTSVGYRNGIEGFWSDAKHILHHYRSVSKYHFPRRLKEIEYRYNHRKENLFKRFIKLVLVTFYPNYQN